MELSILCGPGLNSGRFRDPWRKEGRFSFEFQIPFFIGSAAALLCGGFRTNITRRISRRNSRKLSHRPKRLRFRENLISCLNPKRFLFPLPS
ncbi:hypothetical protein CEXT_176181 [Caerostris extrusa]|uniref:Uncharacterized protein n=1 Tax=Caerostris extrusa TaxID=172846 RepID=A0AAV4URV9_CAEEX|nr:hypothetical protein CEXT_176181 [Caerostris extrusa]